MKDHSDALAQRLQTRPANEARNNALAESNRGIALMKKQEALKAVSEIKKHADNLRPPDIAPPLCDRFGALNSQAEA